MSTRAGCPPKPDLFGLLNEFHSYKVEERISTVFEVRNQGTSAGAFTAVTSPRMLYHFLC
jgi:hypothetical protein